ncbi:KAP family NTPase [Uliginosibacterium sp. 31-12]|uniref:KAP family NTPase n=1 Tax=Uliginosibacterium sp. 31-12 TaxID=3062781 RepID=UPI0026E27277|nr:KAP family NTPase [Uliginosibacterium sp. 31-12]MDO6387194.1 KAP family NTPase [Uliginosibacterium sp. 31-12]
MADQSSPLTFDNRDDFQRRPIAEKVIRLLTSEADVSPLVIDGGWGTGKSEFCQKLIHLANETEASFRAVYVDAFRADHADQPLMTLFAAILSLMPEADRPSLIQKALPVVRFGIKTALKAGVSWVLKQDAADIADDFDKDLKAAGDEAINQSVQALLADHVKAEESLRTLKSALEELASEKPIVLFVDELDRCRPDFAVSMLENIKHVFDVRGVQFVLVTNTAQLKASINHCYGGAVDAQRYLEKFLRFSFKLSPDSNRSDRRMSLASQHYFDDLLDKSKLLKEVPRCSWRDGVAAQLISSNDLSLRDVESLVRHLDIYQSLTDRRGFPDNMIPGYRHLRFLGVFLFCFRPDLAYSVTQGRIAGPEITKVIGSPMFYQNFTSPSAADLLAAMIGFNSSEPFFEFNEDEKKEWDERIARMFELGTYWDRYKPTDVVADVIRALMLVDVRS